MNVQKRIQKINHLLEQYSSRSTKGKIRFTQDVTKYNAKDEIKHYLFNDIKDMVIHNERFLGNLWNKFYYETLKSVDQEYQIKLSYKQFKQIVAQILKEQK